MHKKLIGIFLCVFSLMESKIKMHVQPRVAVGPALHSFFLKEFFELTQKFIVFDNTIKMSAFISGNAPFTLMPYGQGQLRGFIGDCFNFTLSAGTGSFKRGRTVINFAGSYTSTDFFEAGIRNAATCGGVTIVELGFGAYFTIPGCPAIKINPLIGYAYNKEKMHATVAFPDEKYAIKNIWKGPFFGGEFDFFILKDVYINPSYRFVKSTISYQLAFDRTGAIDNLLPQLSSIKLPAHGNLFGLELNYQYRPSLRFGTAINYLRYATSLSGNACFTPTMVRRDQGELIENEITVNSEFIKNIVWQQIMWTFFIEGCF